MKLSAPNSNRRLIRSQGCPQGRDCDHGPVTATLEPSLVPELLVADLDQSMEFWCNLCRFDVAYSRAEERFAYITLGAAHLMLEQTGVGRNWITGPLEQPLGEFPDHGAGL